MAGSIRPFSEVALLRAVRGDIDGSFSTINEAITSVSGSSPLPESNAEKMSNPDMFLRGRKLLDLRVCVCMCTHWCACFFLLRIALNKE